MSLTRGELGDTLGALPLDAIPAYTVRGGANDLQDPNSQLRRDILLSANKATPTRRFLDRGSFRAAGRVCREKSIVWAGQQSRIEVNKHANQNVSCMLEGE